MKARKVKGLDPATPLGDNAERIVRVRLAELYSFMPRAADPAEVKALHDMRIAAKRLRYILEITHPCFGPYAEAAVKSVKQCQEVLVERLRARQAAGNATLAAALEHIEECRLHERLHSLADGAEELLA